jgi:erythromycin esterase-like protein
MGRGVSGTPMGMQYTISAPPSNTVEGVLANGGLKYAFVDFLKAVPGPSTTWFTGKNTVREWGTVPTEIVPARSYDAIFYIDTVTLAEKY